MIDTDDCSPKQTECDPFYLTRDLLHRALGWHEGLGAVGDWPQVTGQAQQIIDQVLNVPVVLDELHRYRAQIASTRKIIPKRLARWGVTSRPDNVETLGQCNCGRSGDGPLHLHTSTCASRPENMETSNDR